MSKEEEEYSEKQGESHVGNEENNTSLDREEKKKCQQF